MNTSEKKITGSSNSLPFLPANESKLFITLFYLYCRWLFRRRFDEVQIQNEYFPGSGTKTLFYLNHHSWWDGLIPFFLNQKLFRQNARGMMEYNQLNRYPFFRRLGVFSIDLSSARSSVQSMRYAVQSMERSNAALYIYPQGQTEPFKTNNLQFKKGIGWLSKKLPEAELVPVGIYIHTLVSDKPRLKIHVGKPVQVDRTSSAESINHKLEKRLSILLMKLTGNDVQI